MNQNQEALHKVWEEHVRHEFSTHDTEETLATMVDDAYVNHIPTILESYKLLHTGKLADLPKDEFLVGEIAPPFDDMRMMISIDGSRRIPREK